jgi:hypothetical protein
MSTYEYITPELTLNVPGSEFATPAEELVDTDGFQEEQLELDDQQQDQQEPGRIQRAIAAAKTAMLGTVVAFEAVPLTNEGARALVFAAAQSGYNNPLLTAAATAATTFAIEASGATAAADLLDGSTGERIYRGLDKVGLSGVHTNVATESAAAMAIGVPLTMALKQQQDPTRTEKQNRKYGLIASSGVSAAVGALSYMTAEGMTAFESVPEKVGVGVIALGGLSWAVKKLRGMVGKQKHAVDPTAFAKETETQQETVVPAYDLSKEELDRLEGELVGKVREKFGKTVASVWVGSHSPYANFIRTHENETFSKLHLPELFEKYEDESAFLITVDTRKGQNKVIRGTRLSSPQFSSKVETESDDDTVRIAMIQDMVEAGQFTNQEFVEYYKNRGIDPNRAVSVETNFRIGGRAPRIMGMIPVSHVAYLSMYNFAAGRNLNTSDACIFAHVNDATINSLSRMGIPIDPLMGNENLRTPAGGGTYDDDFKPVALLNTPEVMKKMRKLKMFAPKEMQL